MHHNSHHRPNVDRQVLKSSQGLLVGVDSFSLPLHPLIQRVYRTYVRTPSSTMMLRLPFAAAGAAAKRATTAAASAAAATTNPALGAVAGIGSRRHVCEKLFIGGK